MMHLSRRHVLAGSSTLVLPSSIFEKAFATPPSTGILPTDYRPAGVGGGGTFFSLALSPVQDLWFVATDMQTLFRSTDLGTSWQPIPHKTITACVSGDSDIDNLRKYAGVGFSGTPNVVFYAPSGQAAYRSMDGGATWMPVSIGSAADHIRFWACDTRTAGVVLAGCDSGLKISRNDGKDWSSWAPPTGDHTAYGAFFDHGTAGTTVYIGFGDSIFASTDLKNFSLVQTVTSLRSFAGGRGPNGPVLAYVTKPEDGGNVFAGPLGHVIAVNAKDELGGAPTILQGCERIAMAENSIRLFASGLPNLPNQNGSRVFIGDVGDVLQVKFRETGGSIWPNSTPVGAELDVFANEGSYTSLAVHQTNSHLTGMTGGQFVHLSTDGGETWGSPLSTAVDAVMGIPFDNRWWPTSYRRRWKSRGLEVCSTRVVKFHPRNPKFGVACSCDTMTSVTEDGGQTWRILSSAVNPPGPHPGPHNSAYDVLFDSSSDSTFWLAMSDQHDFQHWGSYGSHSPADPVYGGVYRSDDRGLTLRRLGPAQPEAQMPYLSLARSVDGKIIYAGIWGAGVACFAPDGSNWRLINDGILHPTPNIASIQIDPVTQDVYALVSGTTIGWDDVKRGPDPNWKHTGIYRLKHGTTRWQLLRGNVALPSPGTDPAWLWSYPTSFAIRYKSDGTIKRLYLADRNLFGGGSWGNVGLWASDGLGQNWRLLKPIRNINTVYVDTVDPTRVYLSGSEDIGASWTDEDGSTITQNDRLPFSVDIWSVTPDPANSSSVFYSIFGGGVWRGPRPT